jgi:hypothetical protein
VTIPEEIATKHIEEMSIDGGKVTLPKENQVYGETIRKPKYSGGGSIFLGLNRLGEQATSTAHI